MLPAERIGNDVASLWLTGLGRGEHRVGRIEGRLRQRRMAAVRVKH
jgi:hypothetical protein